MSVASSVRSSNMPHRKYEKIHRLGKDETIGILMGTCHIQEKVDGANASIWFDPADPVLRLHKGSRSQDVTDNPAWKGFCDYVDNHEGIQGFFKFRPAPADYILYGEWLVRHTIAYKELAYRKFYLYDVFCISKNEFLPMDGVYNIADIYKIEIVPLRATLVNPTEESLKQYVGMTDFGDRGEGIVIKNMDFKNKFGDISYAKIVTDTFKEDNAVTFGGNNKHSDTYWEVYVMNKYVTLERVRKVIQKAESMVDEKLDMKHLPMIMSMVYHDLLSEEIWEIQKKVPNLAFKSLQKLVSKKVKQIFVELLTGDVSIAHQPKGI